jgi:hypothetical protein
VNRAQKAALIVGVAAFVVMGLFPPWVCKYSEAGSRPGGYAFIALGPSNPNLPPGVGTDIYGRPMQPAYWSATRVDTARLATQWVGLAVIVGTILLLLHRGRPSSPPAS